MVSSLGTRSLNIKRCISVMKCMLSSWLQLLIWFCFPVVCISSLPTYYSSNKRDLDCTFGGWRWLSLEQSSSGCHRKDAQNSATAEKIPVLKKLRRTPPHFPYNNKIWSSRITHQTACGKCPQVELISAFLSYCDFLFVVSAPPQLFRVMTCYITEEDCESCQLQRAGKNHLKG